MERTEPEARSAREELRQQYRDRLSQYKSANADLADIAWTLSELEQQISALEAERSRGASEQLDRRIRDLRRWRNTLEENVLRHMYRTEELLEAVAQLRSALAQDAPAQE
jgi:predicted  nucleic acid-binding Zn-ribbon protein